MHRREDVMSVAYLCGVHGCSKSINERLSWLIATTHVLTVNEEESTPLAQIAACK
jgi:hypothetical protein